jgi:hypothetical protein
LADLLGQHRLSAGIKDYQLELGDSKIIIDSAGSALTYRRYTGSELASEVMIVSDEDPVIIGVFPSPPLFTPKNVAKNVYLKFKSPVIVDQRGEAVVYAKMPIEIGVYRQAKDEEILLDAFSLGRQQYALYGSPESGVVCRYVETEVSTDKDKITIEDYREASVRIRISNTIDNVVKVSKVIVPMEGVILDHARDESWLPGSVEMTLDSAFGKEVVNVRLSDTQVKKTDKTSIVKKEETLIFQMDAGY